MSTALKLYARDDFLWYKVVISDDHGGVRKDKGRTPIPAAGLKSASIVDFRQRSFGPTVPQYIFLIVTEREDGLILLELEENFSLGQGLRKLMVVPGAHEYRTPASVWTDFASNL